MKEYKGTQELLAIQCNTGLVQKWESPAGLSYKVNFDVAIFADINASGVGVVVRNDKVEVMASLSAKGPPVQDSEEAEALACQKVMEFAVDVGFTELVLEGNNRTIMKSHFSKA